MTHAALKDLVKKWREEAAALMEEARKAHYLTSLPDKAEDITRIADELSAALSAMEGEAAVEILGWKDNASPRLRFLTKIDRLTAGTILYTAPPARQPEGMVCIGWEFNDPRDELGWQRLHGVGPASSPPYADPIQVRRIFAAAPADAGEGSGNG